MKKKLLDPPTYMSGLLTEDVRVVTYLADLSES